MEALDEGHAMYLISTVRKPAGMAVTPGGLLSVAIFRRQPPQSLIKGSLVAWLGLQGGPFDMCRCRRHCRSMGLFDQLSIMPLGDGP